MGAKIMANFKPSLGMLINYEKNTQIMTKVKNVIRLSTPGGI
jgi:hypothetical protein